MYPDDELHIAFGVCKYPVDWKLLKINPIKVPVAIKIPIDSGVDVQFNREDLIYNNFTKDLILNKIKAATNHFVNLYNSNNIHYNTFREAFDELGSKIHNVIIEGTEFQINDLEPYAIEKVKERTVEGITFREADWYKDNASFFFSNYRIIGQNSTKKVYRRGKMRFEKSDIKQNEIYQKVLSDWKIVELDYTPSGKEKTYLKEKYEQDNYLFITKDYIRTVGKPSEIIGSLTKNNRYYRYLLELTTFPREQWRGRIDEFLRVENEFKKDIIDETKFILSKDYEEWCEDRKERMRLNRIGNGGGKGSRGGKYGKNLLNKQKGQITISKARNHAHTRTSVFDKYTCDISKLHTLKRLNVYFTKEKASEEGFKEKLYKWRVAYPNIDFVWVGDRDIKNVKGIHNFINFKSFKMSKPFARVASSLIIENVLAKVPKRKIQYITESFPKWDELHTKLKSYVKTHIGNSDLSDDIKKVIVDKATELNNWDFNIYSDYQEFKKIVEMFYFLDLVEDDYYYDTPERKKQREKLVYSLIIFQKRKMDNYELVEKVPVEIEEELAEMYEEIVN